MKQVASVFMNGKNQAVRIPKDMEFDVKHVEVIKQGRDIILRPLKPSWDSLIGAEQAEDSFLEERPDVVGDEGRF